MIEYDNFENVKGLPLLFFLKSRGLQHEQNIGGVGLPKSMGRGSMIICGRGNWHDFPFITSLKATRGGSEC